MDGKIAVLGLGYVGLPVAVALAERLGPHGVSVVGFDIAASRIAQLKAGHDATREIDDERLASCGLDVSDDPAVLDAEIMPRASQSLLLDTVDWTPGAPFEADGTLTLANWSANTASIAASELFITQGTSTYAMQFYLGQKSHRRETRFAQTWQRRTT
mgnify:CR=1 FL=1